MRETDIGSCADFPSTAQIEKEVKRERYRLNYHGALRSTIGILITVAASAILVAVLLLPVLQIYGRSMNPTLEEGNIVLTVKGSDFKTGDIVAFYYNNKILIKRVVANPGDWVDIGQDGTVYINGTMIEEPYIQKKAFGETNIKLPYQVPESKLFVLGDNRDVSVDSRNTAVGCVAEEQIVGKIIFRVWPFKSFGAI